MDVSVRAPLLTAAFWRSRRSAAVAGIVFGVLLLVALTMLRIALSATACSRCVPIRSGVLSSG
jgi:hypothetical protein